MDGWSRDDITTALAALGAELEADGARASVALYGGAAMAVSVPSRRCTVGDIDAVFTPRPEVLAAAARVHAPKGWINDAVAPLLPPQPDDGAWPLAVHPALDVTVASPRYLLVAKATTDRQSAWDRRDAALLCAREGIVRREELLGTIQRYYPVAELRADLERYTGVRLDPFVDAILREARALPAIAYADDLPPPQPPPCGEWMPRARRHCIIPRFHLGQHR